jgi:Putative MetA-pathway of phenol degradation
MKSPAARFNTLLPAGLAAALALPCLAQDIEPRRWSHLPIGANFGGIGYGFSTGDITFNPVLRIEDGQFDLHTAALQYIHSFELFGKSARFDLAQAYQSGTWEGRLNGAPASVDREGWADSTLRFAVNLVGAPPLSGKEFAAYNAATTCEDIVGVGLLVRLPTGEYMDDKLINLGSNRYTFTPQFGWVHNQGKWSTELSGSVNFTTDNDEFFNGKSLEEDPYFVGQAHLSYTFRPGLWLTASTGYGLGGESSVNSVPADDPKGNFGWGLSLGIPINRAMGFKLSYIGTRTQEDTGADTDTFSLGFSMMW